MNNETMTSLLKEIEGMKKIIMGAIQKFAQPMFTLEEGSEFLKRGIILKALDDLDEELEEKIISDISDTLGDVIKVIALIDEVNAVSRSINEELGKIVEGGEDTK